MINLLRVCVPLSLDCNLHCRYCYRDCKRLETIPAFNDLMKSYLRQLDPSVTEAVVASGGEPLLHFDKVKELFSYVPKNVHKKIMSNGLLLTQEIVDYINENEIELLVSHDGPKTAFLRGFDVLADPVKSDLIRQVRILHINGVITKFNTNYWENYFDSLKKLKRIDFMYNANPISNVNPDQQYLVDGFNYDEWFETLIQFIKSPFHLVLPWYKGKTVKDFVTLPGRSVGFNVLPDGTVTGMIRITDVYGTVEDTFDDCVAKAHSLGLEDYCKNTHCELFGRCDSLLQNTTAHSCMCAKVFSSRFSDEYVAQTVDYLNHHMGDILQKYFPEYRATFHCYNVS